MPRNIGRPGPEKLHLTPESLAVLMAVALVVGLFAAMATGGSFATGTRLVGPDGCTAHTWRNPVTGRTEAVGRARLDAGGRPLCR